MKRFLKNFRGDSYIAVRSIGGATRMNDSRNQFAAMRFPPSKHPNRYRITEIGIVAAICLSASLAVPVMYAERFNDILWGSCILAFVGLPVRLGIVRGKPAFLANLAAVILLLACPIVFVLTDHLPARFELLRDAFFWPLAAPGYLLAQDGRLHLCGPASGVECVLPSLSTLSQRCR